MNARFSVSPGKARFRGFTLVEIMIVVTLIGLLATLAIPAFLRVQRASRATAFINDLRIARDTMEVHIMQHGFPPDGNTGFPSEMAAVLPPAKWGAPTPIGGYWDWDYEQFGFKAGISVFTPAASEEEMQAIDARIDDGNLATGAFRQRTDGFIYIMAF